MPDPGLMPLPDAAADLDWSNLVDAAKAYEGESADELSGTRGTGRATPSSGGARLWSVCVHAAALDTLTTQGGALAAGNQWS